VRVASNGAKVQAGQRGTPRVAGSWGIKKKKKKSVRAKGGKQSPYITCLEAEEETYKREKKVATKPRSEEELAR